MGSQRVGHDWATFTHFTSNMIFIIKYFRDIKNTIDKVCKIKWKNIYSICLACVHVFSCVQLFVTPRTILYTVRQAPLSMGFSRQEYWSGLPFPTLGDLPDPGMKPVFLVSPKLAGGLFTTESPGKPHILSYICTTAWSWLQSKEKIGWKKLHQTVNNWVFIWRAELQLLFPSGFLYFKNYL